ncbi:hypothetical protein CHU92_12555 [Flavobacterium cyanobacteriorum]|uniref:Uncharacterized protein n=1 Tax=Flavobacterium cyanobacteriorum TaxID=2022802 RepID=A0A255YXF1_9FLAO|nr:hypothetical protein [Flavobacterium cyanobacteriorum]OYQ33913.1 hypothetical protein CHU92_12555 [Flavobacterium cyanobacteriorum]
MSQDKIKTILDLEDTSLLNSLNFEYQEELTNRLDKYEDDFNQDIINEIVLWKINRYAKLKTETLELLNKIPRFSEEIEEELTIKVLNALLNEKGVRLAMASTILRFRNPNIYQILDQRVFRLIQGYELNYKEKDIGAQIKLYIKYLNKLREVCLQQKIEFKDADRKLYLLDKHKDFNKHFLVHDKKHN